jgi:hypothetical protein
MVSSDEGISIDPIDEQFLNARLPRLEIAESGSKVRVRRWTQSLKHSSGIASTHAGIQIDRTDEQPSKTDSPKSKS